MVNRLALKRLTSGNTISLDVYDLNWSPAGFLVRADHNTITIPGTTPIVTYEIGGRDACIYVMEDMPPGYPGYRPGNPAESTFDIIKLVNGVADTTNAPIQNGDHIAIRINSNRGKTFFFRVAGRDSGAEVHADGTQVGEEGTTFIVEIDEVRNGVGIRPAVVKCRSCASVTITATNAEGLPVSGATVAAEVPNHPFTGTTGADGRTTLRDSEGRACVPAGSTSIVVTHPRRKTRTISIPVPDSGVIQTAVQLDCTIVSGKVIDQQGYALEGEVVKLTDEHGTAIADERGAPYVTTTDNEGNFSFVCVPHGFVRIVTDADPSQLHHQNIIPPEGWTDVVILVQTPCSNVVGRVLDLTTRQPIAGAMVRGSGGLYTFTGTDGCFTFVCLRPYGQHTLNATASGYLFGFTQVTVLPGASNTFNCRNLPPDPGDIHDIYLTRVDVSRIRIVATWPTGPDDLDLHTSWPDTVGGRYHVFFRDRHVAAAPYVTLDTDDLNSPGREEITIERSSNGSFVPAEFHVWVHNIWQLSFPDSTFRGTRARIEIFQDSQAGPPTSIGFFRVEDSMGDPHDNVWHIVNLTIDADGLVVQNSIQSFVTGTFTTVL